jgi:hypothetical protein
VQSEELAGYPRYYLLAAENTAEWHKFGIELKEHVAWIAPPPSRASQARSVSVVPLQDWMTESAPLIGFIDSTLIFRTTSGLDCFLTLFPNSLPPS